MRPLNALERQRLMRDNPSVTEQDMNEYETLLARSFLRDDLDAEEDRRLQELSDKLFPPRS